MRRSIILAGLALILDACAPNLPPSPARPLNVRTVFSCAEDLLQARGWQLQDAPWEREETVSAAFTNEASGASLFLAVWREDRGEVRVRVRFRGNVSTG